MKQKKICMSLFNSNYLPLSFKIAYNKIYKSIVIINLGSEYLSNKFMVRILIKDY